MLLPFGAVWRRPPPKPRSTCRESPSPTSRASAKAQRAGPPKSQEHPRCDDDDGVLHITDGAVFLMNPDADPSSRCAPRPPRSTDWTPLANATYS